MPVFNRIVDTLLILKAAGLVAADTAHAILDLGAGVLRGDLVFNWTACEIATGDEQYEVGLFGSNSATFASVVQVLGVYQFGKASVINTDLGGVAGAVHDVDTPATGRLIAPFINHYNGTTYRYVRLATNVAGTIATGFNFEAFITKVGEGVGPN